MDKLGVFGGTFNPIHFGHLRVAEEARDRLGLEAVIFVPSCNPPLKSVCLAPAKDRLEMAKIAVAGNPGFEVSDIECRRPGKSYTVETLAELSLERPGAELHLILGLDAFLDIPAWHRPERLMETANFVVLSRPGFRFGDISHLLEPGCLVLSELDRGLEGPATAPLRNGRSLALLNVTPFALSATAIRALAGAGRSLRYLLPDGVESFIITKHLYRHSEGS